MSIKIEMPKLSDTMTEGTLLRWRKKVGDAVEVGDVIAEVETDKATMEMEAFDDGVLLEILAPEGSRIPVGATIGILSTEGDTDASVPCPTSASIHQAETAPAVPSAPASTPCCQPAAAPQTQPEPAATSTGDGQRIKSSPLARKVAAEKGISLGGLTGTGPGGRIVRRDVDSASVAPATPAAPAAPAAASAPAPAAPATGTRVILPVVQESDEVTPLSTMRRVIAERLLTSKTTIPHFYLTVEADVGQLMELRGQINKQSEKTHGNKFTINDFVMKAVINACKAVPSVNSAFNGDSIVKFSHIGLSVAVAVADGLVTPVIKQAQDKSMLQLSTEIKDMAKRARDGKLKPSEFDGGTITISNLGAYGVEQFNAIVNPPQAAILAIGAIIEKPVVRAGQIVIGKRMSITLSCDHRVIDGAEGARFLAEIKTLIENPALILI